MALPTFKQFLQELMIDFDTNASPSDEMNRIRQMQQVAQQSPERLNRQEMQKAQKEKTAAQTGSSPTKAIDTQVARKKEELLRLQQQRIAAQKSQAAKPNQATPPAV